jgi:hypothetical protein
MIPSRFILKGAWAYREGRGPRLRSKWSRGRADKRDHLSFQYLKHPASDQNQMIFVMKIMFAYLALLPLSTQ